jgi:hypothetical protein
MKYGESTSCGCLKIEAAIKTGRGNKTHGASAVCSSRTKKQVHLYGSWSHMKERCFNEKHHQWKDYGGRGIQVCAQWTFFEMFYRDMESSWFPGATIDRIDNNSHYNRLNCKWSTRTEQRHNRRDSIANNPELSALFAELDALWTPLL